MRHSIRPVLSAVAVIFALGACALDNGTQSGFDGNTQAALVALKVSGNTYDRQNALGEAYPQAERINVSYRMEPLSDTDTAPTPLPEDGRVWWYKNQHADDPSVFTGLHLISNDAVVEEVAGARVELAARPYISRQYCRNHETVLPPAIERYMDELEALQAEINGDVYIRHFESTRDGEDGLRTDIVYVEDLSALNTECDALGTPPSVPLGDSSSQEADDTYRGLYQRAERSFEILS